MVEETKLRLKSPVLEKEKKNHYWRPNKSITPSHHQGKHLKVLPVKAEHLVREPERDNQGPYPIYQPKGKTRPEPGIHFNQLIYPLPLEPRVTHFR